MIFFNFFLEKYQEIGRCFYDIQSTSYLLQQDEQGQYVNIRYVDVDGERRPNFPIMGNGKRLDGYQILDLDNMR